MEFEMNIPIYRAKKIDSNEYVEGYLYNPTKSLFYILNDNSGFLSMNEEIVVPKYEYNEIDPSTLAMSIDYGENFYSIIFITIAIEDHIEATEIQ